MPDCSSSTFLAAAHYLFQTTQLCLTPRFLTCFLHWLLCLSLKTICMDNKVLLFHLTHCWVQKDGISSSESWWTRKMRVTRLSEGEWQHTLEGLNIEPEGKDWDGSDMRDLEEDLEQDPRWHTWSQILHICGLTARETRLNEGRITSVAWGVTDPWRRCEPLTDGAG